MKKVLIFCIFIVTLYSPVTGSPVNLPLDHWAYSFIERMETKGYLDTLAYRTKPYTRGECAEIIIHINSRLAQEEIQLCLKELKGLEKGCFPFNLSALGLILHIVSTKGEKEPEAF